MGSCVHLDQSELTVLEEGEGAIEMAGKCGAGSAGEEGYETATEGS